MLVRRPDEPRRNPFRFGDVATGEHFTDRKAEITELVRDLRSGQSVLVISPRRYGKTSLITAVLERIRKQHILVAYVDLLRTTTKERFANQLAAALYAGLTPSVERAVHRAGELFQSLPLRPKITLNEDGTPSFGFAAARRNVRHRSDHRPLARTATTGSQPSQTPGGPGAQRVSGDRRARPRTAGQDACDVPVPG